MIIRAVPDAEDEELDPVDPLGAIYIENEGGTLLERSVFLDDWFRGLLSGLRYIRSGEQEAVVDLHSSRDPLIWSVGPAGVVLKYKGRNLPISHLAQFESALREAIIEFTEQYRMHKNWPKCTELPGLREWALHKHANEH